MLLRTYLRFQRESGSRPLTESQVQELLSVGAYAYKAANDFGGGYTITIRRDSDASEMVILEYSDAGDMKHHYGDIDGAFSGEPRERDFIAMGAVKIR